jgi:hypothetical protein
MHTEPYRREDWFYRDRLGQIRVWGEVREIEERADQLARGGPGALAALDWWQRLREAAADKGKPLLRHFRFERTVRRLATQGAPGEQAAALQAWLAQTPQEERGPLLAGWLGLFGVELSALPEDLRRNLVQTWLSLPGVGTAQCDVETLLAWLQGLTLEDRRHVLGIDWAHFSRFPGYQLVWLLRTEDAVPGGFPAVVDFLEAWARASPDGDLLQAVGQALTWLRPEAAEPLLGRVLSALDARAANDAILNCLTATDPPMSYRLQQALLQDVVPRLDRDREIALVRALIEQLRGGENTGRKNHLLAWAENRVELNTATQQAT